MSRRARRVLWMLLGLGLAAGPAAAQGGRWLIGASVSVRETHSDLSIEFGCSLRYQGHSPASEGARLRVRLQPGPDCGAGGNFPTERLLPADAGGLVRDLSLGPGVGSGAELVIELGRVQRYVMLPTAGGRGLRLRLLTALGGSAVLRVDDAPGAVGSYAVNLQSGTEPWPAVEQQRAQQLLRVPVYVSTAEVEGRTWYRLRAGPFFSRAQAEAVLRAAAVPYPRAWLAVDDEGAEPGAEGAEALPSPAAARVPRPPGGETREDPTLDAQLAAARRALAARRLDEAVQGLTALLASGDYRRRAEAQEMLALARERKGQLAHAKAEYEEYLRRYPDGAASDRVRQRLRLLRTATLPGRDRSGGGLDAPEWQLQGGVSQYYRLDSSQQDLPGFSSSETRQSALLTDADFVARRRGLRYDFTGRTSAGLLKDFTPEGPGDLWRISHAYAELRDKEWGAGLRLGRQSRGMAGVFGTFDGVLADWQWRPQLGLAVVAGLPADTTRDMPEDERRFIGVATQFGPAGGRWRASAYALAQQYRGEADRRSVGLETHFVDGNIAGTALVDYDLHFAALNTVQALGTWQLPSRLVVNVDAGQQRAPLLSLRNALIGQPTTDFGLLRAQFTPEQLQALAQDRSARLSQGSVSLSRPWGDNGQWTVTAATLALGGTPGSGGVEAMPGLGREDAVSAEMLVNSLWQAGDHASFGLRYQQGGVAQVAMLSAAYRWSPFTDWRLTTRLRMDRRGLDTVAGPQWLLLPSLRVDWGRGRGQFELEGGSEWTRRNSAAGSERAQRLFVLAGYRYWFGGGR